jgi:D-beta-D-heptose 7-phosphate kinase/D-beta-D-heptose 1-phosphate adenosyltransferase
VNDDLLATVDGTTVWVVGDVMMDVYLEGDVERISPEAPVPVVALTGRDSRLGGAANVAANVAALGGDTTLFGIVGDDHAGAVVRTLLEQTGVRALLVADAGRRTTTKTRVLTAGRHVLRIDDEDSHAAGPEVERALLERLAASKAPAVVVVSDYAKGTVTPAVIEAVRRLCPDAVVVLDPKSGDVSAYRGVDWITPNENEARRLLGDDRIMVGADELRRIVGETGAGVVLTRGDRGITLASRDGTVTDHPVEAQEACDVTGAGDTVVATFAAFVGAGVEPERACQLANRAAGVAVAHHGTFVVSNRELLRAEQLATRAGKLLDAGTAARLSAATRRRGGTVVFTNGCFDLLHAGHVHLLVSAKAEGDLLVVGLDDDENIRQVKGPGRPVIPATDRARLLSALDVVDAVVLFGGVGSLEELIGTVAPDVLVKGDDYHADDIVGGADVVRSGGRIVLVPQLPGRSTSAIVSGLTQ